MPHQSWTRRLALGALLTSVAFRPARAAGGDFEAPGPRPAADVLPAAMLRGANYQIGPTVDNFAYMNRYSVASDYGPFQVTGDARLRRLIIEIGAITELKKIRGSDVFMKAAGQAVMGPVRGAKALIEEPVATISAVPEGVFSIFSRASEQMKRGGRSDYEDGAAKSLLQVSSYKREFADKLGFDVYSSNEVLQKELNSVAWTAAAGNLSVGAVSAVSGSAALAAAGKVRYLDQARAVLASEPPQELSKRNRKALGAMQVPTETIDRFLDNRTLSPRHQTVIVNALQSLRGVKGAPLFVRYAAQSENEESALFFQQMAELLAGYSAMVSPIRQIDVFLNLPVGYAQNGSAIVAAPVDRVVWSHRTADIATRIARALPKPLPVKQVEIWIAGDATPRARQEVAALQLRLVERAGQKVTLLD